MSEIGNGFGLGVDLLALGLAATIMICSDVTSARRRTPGEMGTGHLCRYIYMRLVGSFCRKP